MKTYLWNCVSISLLVKYTYSNFFPLIGIIHGNNTFLCRKCQWTTVMCHQISDCSKYFLICSFMFLYFWELLGHLHRLYFLSGRELSLELILFLHVFAVWYHNLGTILNLSDLLLFAEYSIGRNSLLKPKNLLNFGYVV